MFETAAKLTTAIEDNELVDGALRVAFMIRPSWDPANTKSTVFKDGITNKLVGVHEGGKEDDTVLVRVYGKNTEWMINREMEIENIQLLQRYGLAPKLYATFTNGLAYQFLPGNTLNIVTCRDEKIFPLVAEKMAVFHHHLHVVSSENVDKPFLWAKIEHFIKLVPESLPDPDKQKRFREHIPSKDDLFGELAWLRGKLSSAQSPMVLSHNDLLLANILYDEPRHQVHFIDFEYTAPNYQAYDIANHFCEFAGVDDIDHSRYPSKEFQVRWLSTYLAHFQKTLNPGDVEKLVDQVEKFSPAPHFFWAVWALIQAAHSTISFDFLGYAISRLNEYYRRKNLIFQ